MNKTVKKRTGRPRTVSDKAEDYAPAVGVRLPRSILAQVDWWAAQKGVRRSEAIRDMVIYAIAGRMIDGEKASRRRKK